MKILTEIVGLYVISAVLMAVPILCSLSFAYNWATVFKFVFSVVCFFEWICLMDLLSKISDKEDKK